MFRKPWFWAVFVLVSIVATAWAIRHFAEAFPLVTVDVQMDRSAALEAAEQMAVERGWGPSEARQAVEFSLNGSVQSFVELEAGGKEAFTAMLAGDLYSPYKWIVRRFKEGETNEVTIRFRPDGSAYGFRERMPEDEPGASLEPDQARVLAESTVASSWDVDLSRFEVVETSHEVRPGGRTDHTLVYERPDVTIGEGLYRLRLTVSGDRFTELTHFIKIPEAFSLRYEEMRSANNGIATGAGFAMIILYMAGGCVVGLFFLMRERWVVWKPALKWALFVAFLQALVVLNQWPLLWMGYDTAVSSTTFALQQIAMALGELVVMGAVLALSFMAAESLTRRAFPQHVQLWRGWSKDVAPTKSLLGQTVGGYLLIGIFFAYEVFLYFFATNNLGWWSPSSALTDPNVLANYFPWLTSIAVSLQAGFWEECLFRAVPLASAALLGKRFGKPWLWITGALMLQAMIFGGMHANYPTQPAYARMLELIIPALGFGGLYLVFGLVPAIVLHFAFDVVWFAMPLFAASTPGIWIDRVLVILLTLIPLWVVLRARWRSGPWGEVPAEDFNAAWTPPPPPTPKEAAPTAASGGIPVSMRNAVLALAVVGLAAWGGLTAFRTEAPVLETSDSAARAASREWLVDHGIDLPAEWRELSSVQVPLGLQDRFVWTEGGPEAYRDLLGRYLPTPRRTLRYARFEGDVVERAEEYRVYLRPDGTVQRMSHQLPEARPGAQLEEEAAREIVLAAVAAEYELSVDAIEEVSADPSQHPERRDWTFIFKEPAGYPLDQGEARIIVTIAGDEVVDTGRFVHIPEEWERDHRNRRGIAQVVQIACAVLMVLLFLAGAVVAVVRWSRGRFNRSIFLTLFGFMAVLGALQLGNGFRSTTAQFVTAQPWKLQVAIILVGGLIATTALAAVMSLLVGLAHRMLPPQPGGAILPSIAAGYGIGALLAGLGAIASTLTPSKLPDWPSFGSAADSFPLIGSMLSPIASWFTATALMLLVVAVLHAVTNGWQSRKPLGAALVILLGLAIAGSENVETLPQWLIEGTIIGVVVLAIWAFVIRHQPALVPLVTAVGTVLNAIRNAVIGAYPGATAGSIFGAIAVAALSVWWFKRLTRDTGAEVSEAGPEVEPEAATAG